MDQSGLAEDGQRLYPQPSSHPVEDVIQLARVFPLPYDQRAIRPLFDLPTQLPVVFLRAIPRWHELEEEAFQGSPPRREIDINSVLVATTEQEALDTRHSRSPNAQARPAAKSRGPCFAGARASIVPRHPRNRGTAYEKRVAPLHHISQ